MYSPEAFKIEDRATLHGFLRQHHFATLVTQQDGGLQATHVPLVLKEEVGEQGVLQGHLARANPQWRDFAPDKEVLVIFTGPHAYISPAWYQTSPAVPTWNYTAVHACGIARLIEDPDDFATLLLDLGALMGSLVGQTEQNLRSALRQIDAMAPCILFCDELEKALPQASGQGDSGVGARMLGSLLTWLGDHTSDVFFLGTCNDMARMPPELTRAERFDGVFFLDLPGPQERSRIWSLCLEKFQLPAQPLPPDGQWTGAEIHACCRLAALLGLPLQEAARQIVPVAITSREQVERLRGWAAGRCLSASQPGIFTLGVAEPVPSGTPGTLGTPGPRRSRCLKPATP